MMSLSTPIALLASLLLACGSAATAEDQTPIPAAVGTPSPTEQVRTANLVADYFAADPATASSGAVIVLGGSEGGHAVFGPPIRDPNAPALQAILSVGGTIPALVAARADGWPRVLAFLREALSH